MTQTIDVAAVQVADNPDAQALPAVAFQAEQALAKFDPIQARLAQLVERVKTTTFDITTTAGMKTACELRRECMTTRVDAANTYKALNAPMLAAQRGMRQLVSDIESVVSPLETRLDAEIKAQEAVKEAERQRKVAEEEARVKAIREKIQAIATLPAQAARQDAKGITALDRGLAELVVNEAAFGEFTGDVTELVAHIRSELSEMFVLAAEREAEARRVRLEGERQIETVALDRIRNFPLQGLGQGAAALQDLVARFDTLDCKGFKYLQEEVYQAERQGRAQLQTMLAERLSLDAVAAEQKQRVQQAAEQRLRDQAAADKRQQEADAAHAERSQELKRQEDAFEAEKAEARRQKEAADAQLATEKRAAEAHAKALQDAADEQAKAAALASAKAQDLEKSNALASEEAARLSAESAKVLSQVVVKSANKAGTRPSDLGIVTAVSVRFGVSQAVACGWLRTFNADAVLATLVPAPAVAITFEEIPV